MPLRRALHRIAILAERLLERIYPDGRGRPLLEAYKGYATPTTLVLRGRVLSTVRHVAPHADQSKWVNLKQMLSLFMTDEIKHVPVVTTRQDGRALSDEEGYVVIEIARAPEDTGWLSVPVQIVGDPATERLFPVRVPSSFAKFGIISDVDDTMMKTGAYSLARNLWTTFTGSALTRKVFPDSHAMMTELTQDGQNPVFYVSSSPWNLHDFLDRVFAKAGLPDGPMFLRDLGVSETQFVSGTHGDHKGSAIDRILAAAPELPFVLIGDTGQHDAHVYHDAVLRHAGRIEAVVLRQPGPGPDDASRTIMDKIEAAGVPVFSDRTFEGFAERIIARIREASPNRANP